MSSGVELTVWMRHAPALAIIITIHHPGSYPSRFTLLYFTLLYFTLLYFTLLYFTLPHILTNQVSDIPYNNKFGSTNGEDRKLGQYIDAMAVR